MGRREIEPGEAGGVTFRGQHPETGKWVAEAKLKAEGVKPTMWQATCRYRESRTRKRRVLTATAGAKARAETRLKSAVGAAKATERLDPGAGSRTAREALQGHLEALEGDGLGLAPRTVSMYAHVIRRHLLHKDSLLADLPLGEVTTLDVKEEMRRIIEAGGETALRHVRAILHRVFEAAVDARGIPVNPVPSSRSIPRPRRKPKVYGNGSSRTKNRALTEAEEGRLEASLEDEQPHVRDLLLVCMDLGLRVSEATSLRWTDVDLESKAIKIEGKLVRVKGQGLQWDDFGKNSLSERQLPLRTRSLRALTSRWEARRPGKWGEYAFATPRGGAPDVDNYSALCRKAFDRAGLPDVTVHTLRRTVERDLQRAGISVAERERFMGHTEAVARKHYADHSGSVLHVGEVLDQCPRSDSNRGPAA